MVGYISYGHLQFLYQVIIIKTKDLSCIGDQSLFAILFRSFGLFFCLFICLLDGVGNATYLLSTIFQLYRGGQFYW